jgi:nucleoside-diphosphate-sugar epimerase
MMRVAISAADAFVAPYLIDALGDAAVVIPPEALAEQMLLDALLVSCDSLVHFNAHSTDASHDRSDRQALLSMRDSATPILAAVDRHQGLHLVLVGSLRVHPQATPAEPYYDGVTRLAPRDVAAEGQLWVEEHALEHAESDRPVSIVRASNVQGLIKESSGGNGLLHEWAADSIFGWVSVPGDGKQVKDLVHVKDLVGVILAVLTDPPPTREAIAVGTGHAVPMSDLAEKYAELTRCEPQFGQSEENEVWGVVDAVAITERLGYHMQIDLPSMIHEALGNVG